MSTPIPSASWPLDAVLLDFEGVDRNRIVQIPWTIRHACEGTAIFGATGSGKTSGSGRNIAKSMLGAGFGGLVLCAKPDEADRWCGWAEECGRLDDVKLFGTDTGYGFNFLDHELNRSGPGAGISENAVSILMQCAERSGGGKSEDGIWEQAARQWYRNAFDLLRIAAEPVTVSALHMMVTDPKAVEKAIALANARSNLDPRDRHDLAAVTRYFKGEWETMAERTQASVRMNITAILDPLARGIGHELFCRHTTLTPEEARNGSILVIDLPVKVYNELGRFAAVIWKYLFQCAAEREVAGDGSRPLFLFADEAQFFITSKDAEFQTTARSSRTATVYLTQNLPNLLAELGGSGRGKARVDSLLGNLQTKLWHQNSDPETNRWAAEILTKGKTVRTSTNAGFSFGSGDGGSGGSSEQELIDYEVLPREFLKLAKGGPEYDAIVTAVLFQGGREFPNGRHWLPVGFDQQNS
ncbi:type IV secretory system conjugative DNA transfer family protein [Haloferula sargassicola]|uniref:TraD/TraG TraM recognition site domain-containing protein n=1 Tax=Haloferula sargassicola TaxID=490096 RepID=A0ABP9UTI7_9BACT